MGSHGSVARELRLRADDLKQVVRPKIVKGLTRSEIPYGRPDIDLEPLHGKEVLLIVGRFRHRIDGSGSKLSASWEMLTFDLAAVEGTVAGEISGCHVASTQHLEHWLDEAGRGNDRSKHVFVLGPGELVRAVDLAWRDNVCLNGLRLRTNQRQSPWFGSRDGVIKTVTAPHGYFVNGIKRLYGGEGNKIFHEVGIRLCPVIEHVMTPLALVRPVEAVESNRVGAPGTRDGRQIEFADKHADLRAIIVECTADAVRRVFALSSDAFERHLAHRDAPLPSGQHIVFLRHSEYVKRVDVIVSDRVHALRVMTNLCKSPWYGDMKSSHSVAVKWFAADEEKQICGFHGSMGQTMLGSLGVFYCDLHVATDVASKPKVV
ncbi:hypothetical protein PINS_up020320 [Pythium insidiosum]|nr:hypothetical protein PINS_up020320 [Pythium insidiosum]